MSEWILFSDGFPLSANVTEIEIYYDESNPSNDAVRTSTYGRGLWSSPAYYGLPTANFESDETNVPMGCEINFFDLSSGVPHQWSWIFEGGIPETSTEKNPTNIQYLEEGVFSVSLTVTNPSGEDIKTISGHITVNAALLPQVNFMAEDTVLCTNQPAIFVDLTEGCPISWTWEFEPNTITYINGTNENSQNPEVLFDQAGVYSVGLTVTNSAGNASMSKEDYLSIGGMAIPFVETFNEVSLDANGWSIENPDGRETWELTSVSGITGESNAAWMNFYDYTYLNAHDYLTTPLMSFIGFEEVLLTFDYAYAQRYNQIDSLIINISNNCGASWTRVYANGPDGEGSFETAEPTADFFEPADIVDWSGYGYGAEKPIINLSQWAGQANIKVQFEAFNKFGNNLYIDNIEISNTLGVIERSKKNEAFIYPNPAKQFINIIVGSELGVSSLQIVDLNGRSVIESNLNEGNNQLSVENLSKGIYFVNIKGIKYNETRKLIIQ